MTPRPLHAVLRALADTGPPDTDADLLTRFAATRDDEAFAALVKRHGRLVWAVCRHLCRSDAEADDAFQATFLVLVRNAGTVRDAAKLSAWLHGVAYKVCSKSRQAAKRRAAREQSAAARERNGHAVPDSAWDRALAAVHEEVAGLPDTLRVPFVLCCLEGKGQTEAAEQLGWKLGTLSGRLTRAKDAVLQRLSARGLTLGVLATLGLVAVPAAVSAKANGLGQVGFAVPGSVLQLSHGVIGMSVHKVKLLAAGVLLACGLAVSGGSGWVASASAQQPFPTPAQLSPADRVKQLEAELEKAKADAAKAKADAELAAARKAQADAEKARAEEAAKAKPTKEESATSTKRWEYDFVAASDMAQAKFVKFLQDREDKGWEFVGTTPMDDKPVWVFRKPKGVSVYTVPSGQNWYYYPTAPKAELPPPTPPAPTLTPAAPLPPAPATPPAVTLPTTSPPPGQYNPAPKSPPSADDIKALEAELKMLQDRLEALKKQPKPGKNDPQPKPSPEPFPEPKKLPLSPTGPDEAPLSVTTATEPTLSVGFVADKFPLDPEEVAAVVRALADKKFGNGVVKVEVEGKTVHVHGGPDVVDWAQTTVEALRK